jgi:hypothetical protein
MSAQLAVEAKGVKAWVWHAVEGVTAVCDVNKLRCGSKPFVCQLLVINKRHRVAVN